MPVVTQAEPTGAPRRDDNGFERDRWGLPLIGPARAAMLAELGKPDPNDEPDAWSDGEAHDVPVVIPAADPADEAAIIPGDPPHDAALGGAETSTMTAEA